MTIPHNIVLNEDGTSVASYFINGKVEVVNESHPNFLDIVTALGKGIDPGQYLNPKFAVIELDDRVSVVQEALLFDGVPIHSSIARKILTYRREGRDPSGLVRFLERVNENPSEASRNNLFDWVEVHSLIIDDEGFIIGFKGVQTDLTSRNTGHAVVNGVAMDGHIPNDVGNIISMPRELVQTDPNVGCSYGLHVGTFDYARDWSSVVVLVKVDPADVVSVPNDAGFAKMRCCKYEVIEVHEGSRSRVVDRFEPEPTINVPTVEDIFETDEGTVPLSWIQKLRSKIGI